jgi:hypothetical protein
MEVNNERFFEGVMRLGKKNRETPCFCLFAHLEQISHFDVEIAEFSVLFIKSCCPID